jgi:glucose/arabinose dehydrogenase
MKKFLLFLLSFVISFSSFNISSAQVYPPNFSQVEVASGIANPTVMAFAPDGRIFVAQQNGVLHVIKNGIKLATPAIQLPVNSSGERGLIGITLHPSFSTNGIIYLYYTLPDGSHNRVSRFWLSGDVLNPSTEQIIFELDPLSSATNHNGGAMGFRGNALYIAVGDNANSANSQNLETTHGKILRINANGSIPGSNPFYSTTASRQRNSIWTYGFRNPYTFDIWDAQGRVFVNDVGQNSWEEINDSGAAPRNFGWPATEGYTTNPSYTSPVYAYAHGAGDGLGCAITGGVFFNPASTNYPSTLIGKYFFQDLCNGWINYLDLLPSGQVTRNAFATGLPGQSLALDLGTDGNLYFLSRTAGKLYKIIYNGSQSPVITDQPDNVTVAPGESASFSVSVTGATPLFYSWRKNGVDLGAPNSPTYTISNVAPSHAGNYSVRVTNSAGEDISDDATLTVQANSPPTTSIITPAVGAMYRGGDVINFSGDASDPEDGTLPASAFSWSVAFHHADHVHDSPPIAVGVKTGSFNIPTTGETSANVFYRLHLTVQDSKGLTNTTFVDIKPYTTYLTLQSNPPGLSLTMDGQPFVTPYTVKSVEGIQRTIGMISPQTLNGITYTFASWTNGLSNTQTFLTPVDNTTYNGNFSKPLTSPWRTTDIGKLNVPGDASISSGTYTLSASGVDIWNAEDHFRFVYQPMTGDSEIRARVTGVSNTHAWAKAGVMIRESLLPNAKHASMFVTPSSGTSFQKRVTIAGPSTATNAAGAAPIWLRLVRNANNFSAYTSPDGSTWTQVGTTQSIAMASAAYVGLALTSHNANTLGTATMTNVSVFPSTGATGLAQEIVLLTEQTEGELQLFPNPANGDVITVLSSQKNLSDCRIQVLNSLGQVIVDKVTDWLSAGDDIDLRNIPPGFYFVRVDSKWHKMAATFVRK